MGVTRRPGGHHGPVPQTRPEGVIILRCQKYLWYVFYVGIREGVGS